MDALLLALLAAGLIDQETADRMNRQMYPAAARAWAEAELMRAFNSGLSAQQGRAIELLRATDFKPTTAQLDTFWTAETEKLWASTGPTLTEVALERAAIAGIKAGKDFGTFAMQNENVLSWVNDYYLNLDAGNFGSIPNLNDTSKTLFARAFNDWQRGELETAGTADGLPQLVRALQDDFGVLRANRIAVTETTRVFTESVIQAEEDNEFTTGFRYLTARDETVCPICVPGNNAIAKKGSRTFSDGGGFPPRHVFCRCDVSPETEETLKIAPTGGQPVTPALPVVVAPEVAKFVEAQNKKEAISRLQAYSSGTMQYKQLTLDEMNSVLRGLDSTLGGKGITIERIGWQPKSTKSLGQTVYNSKTKEIGLDLSKEFVTKSSVKDVENTKIYSEWRKSEEMKKLSEHIADPRRSGTLEYNTEKLEAWKVTERWGVYVDAKDPVSAVTTHEGFHVLDFNSRSSGQSLSQNFGDALQRKGVTKNDFYKVSEYGASGIDELWAETGTAIIHNVPIPKEFIDTFWEVYKP